MLDVAMAAAAETGMGKSGFTGDVSTGSEIVATGSKTEPCA